MKKNYLLIAAAAAMFAACSQNDVVNEIIDEEVEIGFGSEAVSKTTRAVEGINLPWFQTLGNSGSGHRFGVYGFKNEFKENAQYEINSSSDIFTNEEVWCSARTMSSGENPTLTSVTWSHNTVRFWDKGATKAYNFYAYAPYATTGVTYAKGSITGEGTNEASRQNYSPTFNFTSLPLIAEITEENCDADKMVASAIKATDYTTISSASHTVPHYNPAAPTVPFTFNHILSKLSFKVVTPIQKVAGDSPNQTGVATFTVKQIQIDVPQISNVSDLVSFNASTNSPVGVVTYTGTPAKSNSYDATGLELVYKSSTGYVVPSTYGENPESAAEPTLPQSPAQGDVASKTYIVTPVNATVTGHTFGVKVTYDVTYPNGVSENGCTAEGEISYSPAQNQYYVVVIKIDPAKVEFCVESVTGWDLQAENGSTFEVR